MKRRIGILATAAFLVGAQFCSLAQAHPHVWTKVRSDLIMEGRKIVAVKHSWTFDEAFSAFASQGLDENRDGVLSKAELQPLAQVNVESLAEYDFFTDLYPVNGKPSEEVVFSDPIDYWLEKVGDQLVLHFTLPVIDAMDASKTVRLDVYDPTFFVDFSFAEKKTAKLVGASRGCGLELKTPQELDDETLGLLAQIPDTQRDIPEELMKVTSTLANQVLVTCK